MTTIGRARDGRLPRAVGGFTLIELVLVMILVGLLSAAALPALYRLEEGRAATAATRLLADVSYARQRAVATGTRTWVTFDAGAGTWALLEDDPLAPGLANAAAIIDPSTGVPIVQSLGSDEFPGVAIVAADFDGDVSVGFDWLGRPVAASGAMLAVPGSVELSGGYLVTVEPETGFVREG